MGRTILLGGRELYVVTAEDEVVFSDQSAALAFVRQLAEDPGGWAQLRDLAAEATGLRAADTGEDEDEGLLERLADLLVSGVLRVIHAPGLYHGGVAAVDMDEEDDDEQEAAPTRSTWIEIELLDELK